MLLLAVWLGAVAPAAAQTAYSWNTGDGTWDSTAGNWDPAGGPPDNGDDATLGDLPVAEDAEVSLSIDAPALNALEVTGGVNLFTNGFDGESVALTIGVGSRLVVQDGSIFENGSGTIVLAAGVLLVEDGGTYVGGEVTIGSGTDAQLTGGRFEIRRDLAGGFLNVNSTGELFGWGTVYLGDPSLTGSGLLDNDGTVRTARPSPDPDDNARHELIIDTDVNETDPLIDLDGDSENGTVSLAHTTTLTVLGTLSDGFSNSIDLEPDSILNISQPWTIDGGTLELDDGEVTGGRIRNDGGTIRGHGRITSTRINNFGTIEADVGTLVIDTVNPSQLDGAAPNNGQGILRAVTGDLEVASNVTTVFNGLLEVGSTRTFTMSQPGSRFRNAPASEDDDGSGDFGRINLIRGTFVAENFEQASELSAIGISTLDVDNITFESGSLTEIVPNPTNRLELRGNTVVEAGATFAGGGTLRNLFDSSLTLLDGASLDAVHLQNDGNLEIGSSAGAATVDSFEQTSALTATWIVEIGGTAPGTEYDQLIVTNDAQLDGALEVELIDAGAGLFAPSLGDMFEILVADSVSGGFSQTTLPVLSSGLFWHVVTQPDAVLLAVADHIAGDYNRNGAVDAADYVVWRKTLNSTSELAADGNLDGTVNDADYAVWRTNFGAVAGGGSLATVPEPTALWILVLGMASLSGRIASARGRDNSATELRMTPIT